MSLTCSGARGAPPPPTDSSVLRSRFVRSGVDDEIASHCCGSDERGDLLALDQLGSLGGIPLVHRHDLALLAVGHEVDRVRAGGVKQRNGEQGCRLVIELGCFLFVLDERRGQVELPGHQRAEDVAMAADRPLGMTGRARGVQDDRVVGGRDRVVGQARVRVRLEGFREVAHVLTQLGRGTNGQDAECELLRASGQTIESLLVGDEHLGAAVLEPVFHLLGGPERIHRHRHRTERRHCHEREDPLRIVAHRDRHPITLLDAVFAGQQGRYPGRLLVRVLERVALVLVDDEGLAAPVLCKQIPERQRCVLEGSTRLAELLDGDELEGLTWGCQLSEGLGSSRHR